VEIKCQLDATEVFIADLIACSTCFGHHHAHHQELLQTRHIEPIAPSNLAAVVTLNLYPSPYFLIWASTCRWLTSTYGRWACPWPSLPRWQWYAFWGLVFQLSCCCVIWVGWPSQARDRRQCGSAAAAPRRRRVALVGQNSIWYLGYSKSWVCLGNLGANPYVCSRGTQGLRLWIDVWARWPVAGLLASLYLLLVLYCVFSIVTSRAGLCGFDHLLSTPYT